MSNDSEEQSNEQQPRPNEPVDVDLTEQGGTIDRSSGCETETPEDTRPKPETPEDSKPKPETR